MTLNDVLIDIKTVLSSIADIKSIKIGIETGLGSKDCPFIRIVPASDVRDGQYRNIEVNIVYGFDVKNKDLELMYEKLYSLQEQIISTLQYNTNIGDCFYISTMTDEDRLTNLKSSISRFRIENILVQ